MQMEKTTVNVTVLGQTVAHRVELVSDDMEQSMAALCPDLPGCCSQGDGREEALANIAVAIKDYLEVGEELRLRKGSNSSLS
jgi:predicted RNase H-like HicB family nuclease